MAVWTGVSQVAHTANCLGTRIRVLSPGRSRPVLLTGHWHTGLPSQPGLGEAQMLALGTDTPRVSRSKVASRLLKNEHEDAACHTGCCLSLL